MTLIKTAVCAFAVLSLAACGMMPGSGSKSSLSLSGAQEVPPVSTSGSGTGSIRVASDGSMSGSVTTRGVQGMAAHIHQGAKGQNGPVLIPLTKSGDTYSVPSGAKLNAAQMAAYKAGNLYVNVHSPQHKGGEVRAQLQP